MWMLLKLMGVFAFIQKVWLHREARRSYENLARFQLNVGSEPELRALVTDARNMLSNETVNKIILKLSSIKEEKEEMAKAHSLLHRGPIN